jgi:hypothetical protein
MTPVINHNNATQNFYQSKLSPFNKNLCSGFTLNDNLPDAIQLLMHKVSLSALYTLAYGVLQKKIIQHTLLRMAYTAPLHTLYCYALRIPYRLRQQQADFMQQDLAKHFPQYHVYLENIHLPLVGLAAQTIETEVLIITHTDR